MWFVEPKLGKDNLLPRFTVLGSCYTKQLCISFMKNDAHSPNYSSTESVEQPNWEVARFLSRVDKRHEGMVKSSFANSFLSCNHVAYYGHILQHPDCIYPTCNRDCPGRNSPKIQDLKGTDHCLVWRRYGAQKPREELRWLLKRGSENTREMGGGDQIPGRLEGLTLG